MKQHQSHISISWVIATAFALASAGALAGDAGKVNAGGRSANEVQGRASASPAGARVNAVRATGNHSASEVLGRGNQMPKGSDAPIGVGDTEIGDFGRSSVILARNKSKHGQEDVTIATTK